MKYLLDTCVISEIVKPVPNSRVTSWLDTVPSDALFLTHNLILATRNERDFEPSHVPLINPWELKEEENERKEGEDTER